MDIRNVTSREEDANNKTRLYVYTAHLLATPFNVPVRQMPLDLDNGLLGVVLLIGKNKDDTIGSLDHAYTCSVMNKGNLLFNKYILKNIHHLSLDLFNTAT